MEFRRVLFRSSTTWEREVGQNVPDACQKGLAAAFESGISKEMEIECNGRIFSCIVATILAEGNINIYGQDIPEHKQTEETLEASEERFRSTFDFGPVPMLLSVPPDGRFIQINQ